MIVSEGGDAEGGEVGVWGEGDGGERGGAGEEEELAVGARVGPAHADVEEGEGDGEDGGELEEPRRRRRQFTAGAPLHCFPGDGEGEGEEDGGRDGIGSVSGFVWRANWCGP